MILRSRRTITNGIFKTSSHCICQRHTFCSNSHYSINFVPFKGTSNNTTNILSKCDGVLNKSDRVEITTWQGYDHSQQGVHIRSSTRLSCIFIRNSPGVNMTPPEAPCYCFDFPYVRLSSKAFLMMAISSEIEDFAASYFSAKVFKTCQLIRVINQIVGDDNHAFTTS